MSGFVGKFVLNSLIGMEIADVEKDGEVKKCILIPIADNDIIRYGDEWQLWFRAMGYREPRGKFTHFLMKFIPRWRIKKMSAAQIEAFANHSIGAMMRSKGDNEETPKQEEETPDFITDNL